MSVEEDEAYRRGLLEGRLSALEDRQQRSEIVQKEHAQRLTAQERITYSLLGALALIQVWPIIQGFVAT
jgi:hypothetical protein